MTQKQLVLDAVGDLPNDVSLGEITERVDFMAAVQKGFDELNCGERIPLDEVKRQLASWLTK